MLTPHSFEDLRNPSELIVSLLATGISVSFEANGTSMLPTIRPGDKLLVTPVEAVPPGEIVLIKADRGLTAHRVVRVESVEGRIVLVTRGDNADTDDPEIGIDALLGKVTCVTRDGKRFSFDRRSRSKTLGYRFLRRARSLVATLFQQ